MCDCEEPTCELPSGIFVCSDCYELIMEEAPIEDEIADLIVFFLGL